MFTEIYFAPDDAEIVEYFEELEKANTFQQWIDSGGEDEIPPVPDVDVLRQWASAPVRVYEDGVAEGETPDFIYAVLLRDSQYQDRIYLFTTPDEIVDEENDTPEEIEAKEKRNSKRAKMKSNKADDKTFKKLEAKFKKGDGSPLHVFGPKGKTQHAPGDRDGQGEDEE